MEKDIRLLPYAEYVDAVVNAFGKDVNYELNQAGKDEMKERINSEHADCRHLDVADYEQAKRDGEENTIEMLNTFEIAVYGDNNDIHNIALECTRCNSVIIDTDTIEADQE